MAKLRPTQFFNHTKEKALSSKQCVEIFTGVVFPFQYDNCLPKKELFMVYGTLHIFLGIKLFCLSRQKSEIFSISLIDFLKLKKISAHSNNFYSP